MIEFHGWIVIRESYCEENDSESHLKEILEELSKKIFLLKNEVSDIDINLQSKNSIYQVSMFSAANHKGYTWDQAYILKKWIAENAVGSYGLIYMLDDEDIINGNEDKFIVYCIKKGEIHVLEDKCFSPLVPEIED